MLPQAVAISISRDEQSITRRSGTRLRDRHRGGRDVELHDFSMQHILPRIGVISTSAALSF
jgi:hypothetical protein